MLEIIGFVAVFLVGVWLFGIGLLSVYALIVDLQDSRAVTVIMFIVALLGLAIMVFDVYHAPFSISLRT